MERGGLAFDNNVLDLSFLHPCRLVPSRPRPPFPPLPSSFPPLATPSFSLPPLPCLPQRFVQPTVVATAFVCQAAAAATRAGRAPGVTRGRVTLAATSTAPARTASVNAAPAGTESTAPLVGGACWGKEWGCRFCLSVCVRACGCVCVCAQKWVMWHQVSG